MEKTGKQTQGNIIKIVFFGPESTGKSTIASWMADYYDTQWVREYLREFAVEKYANGDSLVYNDNLLVAEGQLKLEKVAFDKAKKFVFCDTDILQTIVYSYEYYGKVQDKLEALLAVNSADLYILMNLDVEWEPDPLRDMEGQRERMYAIFEEELKRRKLNYIVLEGDLTEKFENAKLLINNYYN